MSQKWEDCLEHKCPGESEDVHSTSFSLPCWCLLISFVTPTWGLATVQEGEEGPGFFGVGIPYGTSLSLLRHQPCSSSVMCEIKCGVPLRVTCIKNFFLLEYSCFTILCQFLLYSKVSQLYVYIDPVFFGFLSHSEKELSSRFSLVIYFMHSGGYMSQSFPGGTSGKEPACQCRRLRDTGLISGSGRSPGEGNGNPLQYSCLKNPMDRGASWDTVHGVTLSQIQLKQLQS